MILPKYSPKEVLILESVIELFFGGAPLYSMKIADIAAEAGIGKGTVYEYFSSKEELLGKAIAYQILQEIKEISQEIVQAKDFKQCTFAILSRISHCKHSVSPPFMLLRPEFTEANEVKKIFKEMKKTYKEIEQWLTDNFLKLGIDEGIISAQTAKDIGQQTVVSAFAGFHILLHNEAYISVEQLKENTYTIIVNSLH